MTGMVITPRASIPSPRMGSTASLNPVPNALRQSATTPGLRIVEHTGPADLLLTWQTTMRAERLSERTVTEWAAIVRRAARAAGQPPDALTTAALSAYLARFRNANTASTYYRGLAAWHAWLVRTGRLDEDPMAVIRPPKVPAGVPHPITTAGLERLLSARLRRRTRAMVLLGAYQGLRAHEIARVRAEDLDLDAHELRVVGKGNKDAVLPLHELVAEAAADMPRRGWWFPSSGDRRAPMLASSVSWTLSKTMARVGVGGSAHSLRHWFATALFEAGADAVTVQKLMRHESLATTQVYCRADFGRMRAAGARLPRPRPALEAVAALPVPTGPPAAPDPGGGALVGLDRDARDALLLELLMERHARGTS